MYKKNIFYLGVANRILFKKGQMLKFFNSREGKNSQVVWIIRFVFILI